MRKTRTRGRPRKSAKQRERDAADRMTTDLEQNVKSPIAMEQLSPTSIYHMMWALASEKNQWFQYHNAIPEMTDSDTMEVLADIAHTKDESRSIISSFIDTNLSPIQMLLAMEEATIKAYAQFAQEEPVAYAKTVFDYILADHVEHADLIASQLGASDKTHNALQIVNIREGRPIENELIDSADAIKMPLQIERIDPASVVHIMALLNLERTIWDMYHIAATDTSGDSVRDLLDTVSMVEQSHASMLESLLDPNMTTLTRLLFSEMATVELYDRFLETEQNPEVRNALQWLLNTSQENMNAVGNMLWNEDGIDPADMTESRMLNVRGEIDANTYVNNIMDTENNVYSDGEFFVDTNGTPILAWTFRENPDEFEKMERESQEREQRQPRSETQGMGFTEMSPGEGTESYEEGKKEMEVPTEETITTRRIRPRGK